MKNNINENHSSKKTSPIKYVAGIIAIVVASLYITHRPILIFPLISTGYSVIPNLGLQVTIINILSLAWCVAVIILSILLMLKNSKALSSAILSILNIYVFAYILQIFVMQITVGNIITIPASILAPQIAFVVLGIATIILMALHLKKRST